MGAFKVLADIFEQHTSTKPDSVLSVLLYICVFKGVKVKTECPLTPCLYIFTCSANLSI